MLLSTSDASNNLGELETEVRGRTKNTCLKMAGSYPLPPPPILEIHDPQAQERPVRAISL